MHFLNYYNYDIFRFFMINLLESSLLIHQLLYQIYYQHNFFVFNKCIQQFSEMLRKIIDVYNDLENKSL